MPCLGGRRPFGRESNGFAQGAGGMRFSACRQGRCYLFSSAASSPSLGWLALKGDRLRDFLEGSESRKSTGFPFGQMSRRSFNFFFLIYLYDVGHRPFFQGVRHNRDF